MYFWVNSIILKNNRNYTSKHIFNLKKIKKECFWMHEPKTWFSNLQAMIAGIRAKYLIFELTSYDSWNSSQMTAQSLAM